MQKADAIRQLATESALALLATPGSKLFQAATDALEQLAQLLGSPRAVWFDIDGASHPATAATALWEWAAEGLPPGIGAVYRRSEVPELFDVMEAGAVTVVDTAAADTAPLPSIRAVLKDEGLAGGIIVPVLRDGGLIGGVSLDLLDSVVEPDNGTRAAMAEFATVMGAASRRSADVTRAAEVEALLRQKQKLETLGVLVGGVAHDFNNILQVIRVSAALVRRDPVRNSAFMDDIVTAVGRGAELTTRLLLSGRHDVELAERVATEDCINAVTAMARRILPDSIVVATDVQAPLPELFVPRASFEQALLNLLTNASHAMPDGGSVHVNASSHADQVIIEVIDTGKGMTAEEVKRACDPFFTTKAATEGTGLGLAMVNGLATQAGGRVDITSELGSGTCVRLVLPEAREGVLHAQRTPPVDEHDAQLRGTGTLLVVEDNSIVRRVTRSVLEGAGYTVFEAADGEVALQVLSEQPGIQLVITDVIMPRMSGRALYEATRERGLPFVFSTAYSGGEVTQQLLARGDCDLVLKPWTPTQLLTHVRRLVRTN